MKVHELSHAIQSSGGLESEEITINELRNGKNYFNEKCRWAHPVCFFTSVVTHNRISNKFDSCKLQKSRAFVI